MWEGMAAIPFGPMPLFFPEMPTINQSSRKESEQCPLPEGGVQSHSAAPREGGRPRKVVKHQSPFRSRSPNRRYSLLCHLVSLGESGPLGTQGPPP